MFVFLLGGDGLEQQGASESCLPQLPNEAGFPSAFPSGLYHPLPASVRPEEALSETLGESRRLAETLAFLDLWVVFLFAASVCTARPRTHPNSACPARQKTRFV